MLYASLRQVFRHIRYAVGAVGIAFLVLSSAAILPNYQLVVQILTSEVLTVVAKGSFVASLYGSLITNFSLSSLIMLVLTAILFGVNIAFLTYYIRRRQVTGGDRKTHLAGIGGTVSAVLGIGCAACGSVVLTAVLGMFGASGALLFLPHGGVAFAVLGILLLATSTYYLAKRIADPLVCLSP